MIDPALTKLSQWIVYEFVPKIKTFFSEYFKSSIFNTMNTEELQVYFIKITLEAILIIIIYKIGFHFARKARKKARNKPTKSQKQFQPKKWSPTGWYWDDDKQTWIAPDYISKESQERWKWDPEKKIWIDLDPPK